MPASSHCWSRVKAAHPLSSRSSTPLASSGCRLSRLPYVSAGAGRRRSARTSRATLSFESGALKDENNRPNPCGFGQFLAYFWSTFRLPGSTVPSSVLPTATCTTRCVRCSPTSWLIRRPLCWLQRGLTSNVCRFAQLLPNSCLYLRTLACLSPESCAYASRMSSILFQASAREYNLSVILPPLWRIGDASLPRLASEPTGRRTPARVCLGGRSQVLSCTYAKAVFSRLPSLRRSIWTPTAVDGSACRGSNLACSLALWLPHRHSSGCLQGTGRVGRVGTAGTCDGLA